jgi:hypothetical protein
MKALMRSAAMVAALAVLAPPGHAQSADTLELASRLFERAGLTVQLQSFSAQFEQGLSQNRGKIPDEAIAALAEAGRKAFAVDALREEIVRTLAGKLPAADMRQALAWLEGQVGRRMTLAEESASGNMTPENMQAYFESEKQKPPSPERAGLIADLIAATKAVEISASFIEALSLGIAVGMDAAQPVEKRIGFSNLRARLRAAMPPGKLRANMSAALPGMNRFIYRGISDADLAAYVEFNGSALGQRYNQAVTEALAEALTRASVRVGELMQAAPEKKKI